MSFRFALPVLSLAALFIPPTSAYSADEEEESGGVVLTLKLSFPAGSEISEEAIFWGRLWEYDPFLADASAKEVDSVEINAAKFEKGDDGVVTVSTKLETALRERMKYYVTVRVYPDATKDESSRRYFLDGFNKVFEDGKGQTLEAKLKPPR